MGVYRMFHSLVRNPPTKQPTQAQLRLFLQSLPGQDQLDDLSLNERRHAWASFDGLLRVLDRNRVFPHGPGAVRVATLIMAEFECDTEEETDSWIQQLMRDLFDEVSVVDDARKYDAACAALYRDLYSLVK